MKKHFKYLIFLVWTTVLVSPIIYYALSLKFPTVTGGFVGYLVLFVPLIFPCLLLCLKKRTVFIDAIFVFLFILSIVLVYFSTLGFEAKEPVFYPLVSQTNKVENYLIIDEDVIDEEVEKMLRDIFPESIPNEATEITYDYFYGAGAFSMDISVKWKLPYDIYIKEKNKYALMELNKTKDGFTYTEYSDINSCLCSVTFYDDKTIEYKFQYE